jgi:hypothetical protein
MAYYLRRESDPTPVYEVRDKWGDVHVVTKGTLYKIAERQRKDKAARQKRIAARAAAITVREAALDARLAERRAAS